MIQFQRRAPRIWEYRFSATCPVCQQFDIAIECAYHDAQPECDYPGGFDEPEIVEQGCNCLLGTDFARDAFGDYLQGAKQ